jgi:hypothetical protein
MERSFSRLAGYAGVAAGILGLLYLIAFLIQRNPSAPLPSVLLMLGGIVTSLFAVGLYIRVRGIDEGMALWGWLLASAGAAGAAIHGAFDLANALHPPAAEYAYPNPVDPRGFLTFAIAGLSTLVFSGLLLRGAALARGAAILGLVSGVAVVALYVAYLVIFDATSPVVVGLVLVGGVIQPVWTIWIGSLLVRESPV